MPLDARVELSLADDASAAAQRDADLTALHAAGQRELVFACLAERYAPKVHRLCLALLREPAAAEDAAQDSLLRAWRSLDRYDPRGGAWSTWLYAITRNRCLTLLGRSGAAGPVLASMADEAVQAEAEAVAVVAASPGDDAGHALLRRLVDALPEAQRLALTLYYYEERAVAEVAERAGVPIEGPHPDESFWIDQLEQQGRMFGLPCFFWGMRCQALLPVALYTRNYGNGGPEDSYSSQGVRSPIDRSFRERNRRDGQAYGRSSARPGAAADPH